MNSTDTKVFYLKVFIHLAALLPLFHRYYLALNDKLGGDPVEAIIHFSGIGAFNLLLLTLTISPLAKQFKRAYLLRVRRLFGLYTFFYALLHLLNFLAFEIQFDFVLFIDELLQRPYIYIGFFAFLLLVLLALTSFNIMRRRLGKSWQKIHNGIYVIVILVAWHFYWSVKSDISTPLIYILLTVLLLLFRWKKVKKSIFNRSKQKQ